MNLRSAVLVASISLALLAVAAPFASIADEPEPAANNSKKFWDIKPKRKLAQATVQIKIDAPKEVVWGVLVDFPRYPEIFQRIKSCKVTHQDGSSIYCESNLKPQMFVSKICQHTINDVSNKPDALLWKQIDGNFDYVEGQWDLSTIDAQSCQAKYKLAVDPGPIIPGSLLSWVMQHIEKEIVESLKKACEKTYKASKVT